MNPILITVEVESTIDTNIIESTDTNTTNNQYQCEMCEFRCQCNKSLQMHMLKKHGKTKSNEDSNEVTMSIKDNTTPTLHHPISPTTTPTTPTINPTLNHTTNEQIAPICYHFQRGACSYGENCWKRHEPPINPTNTPTTNHTAPQLAPPNPSHFTCTKCNLRCKNSRQLNDHIYVVHDCRYSCELCNFKCNHESRLRTHMKTYHPEDSHKNPDPNPD